MKDNQPRLHLSSKNFIIYYSCSAIEFKRILETPRVRVRQSAPITEIPRPPGPGPDIPAVQPDLPALPLIDESDIDSLTETNINQVFYSTS